MSDDLPEATLARPERVTSPPLPALPAVEGLSADDASVTYSTHRTKLSRHRTQLSEHRTDLSEFRTDLSAHRTNLSTHRTAMSKRRTGMSFQRTRMSADRTLMSVIRTSLSLIGFGFTIYQTFDKFRQAGAIVNANAPRNFGIALVAIGILVLIAGIIYHLQFMTELRHTRREMAGGELIYGQSRFPISFILIAAIALLLVGFAAIGSMVFKVSLFG